MKHSDKKQLSHPKSVNVYLHPHQTILTIWSDIYIYRTCTTHLHDQTTQSLGHTYIIFVIIFQMAHRATWSSSFVVKAIQNFSLKMIDAGIIKHNATPPPPPPHTHTHSTAQHNMVHTKARIMTTCYNIKTEDESCTSIHFLAHAHACMHAHKQVHTCTQAGTYMHTNRYIHKHRQVHTCTQTGTYMHTDRHVCSMHPLILTGRLREGGGGGGYDWQLKQRI